VYPDRTVWVAWPKRASIAAAALGAYIGRRDPAGRRVLYAVGAVVAVAVVVGLGQATTAGSGSQCHSDAQRTGRGKWFDTETVLASTYGPGPRATRSWGCGGAASTSEAERRSGEPSPLALDPRGA
jgi:hypothetical protein